VPEYRVGEKKAKVNLLREGFNRTRTLRLEPLVDMNLGMGDAIYLKIKEISRKIYPGKLQIPSRGHDPGEVAPRRYCR
jgi:hypothetical protein